RYDVWFKTCVVQADQLSLMYNRSLSLTAQRLERDLPHVMRIATAGREMGFSPLVQVSVAECLRHPAHLSQLLGDGKIGTLFLDAAESEGVDREACAALIRRIAPTGVALILYGAPEFWTASGVLTAPELNGVSFQILPIRQRPS